MDIDCPCAHTQVITTSAGALFSDITVDTWTWSPAVNAAKCNQVRTPLSWNYYTDQFVQPYPSRAFAPFDVLSTSLWSGPLRPVSAIAKRMTVAPTFGGSYPAWNSGEYEVVVLTGSPPYDHRGFVQACAADVGEEPAIPAWSYDGGVEPTHTTSVGFAAWSEDDMDAAARVIAVPFRNSYLSSRQKLLKYALPPSRNAFGVSQQIAAVDWANGEILHSVDGSAGSLGAAFAPATTRMYGYKPYTIHKWQSASVPTGNPAPATPSGFDIHIVWTNGTQTTDTVLRTTTWGAIQGPNTVASTDYYGWECTETVTPADEDPPDWATRCYLYFTVTGTSNLYSVDLVESTLNIITPPHITLDYFSGTEILPGALLKVGTVADLATPEYLP